MKLFIIVLLLILNFSLINISFIPNLWMNLLLGCIFVASYLGIVYFSYSLIKSYLKKIHLIYVILISFLWISILLFTVFVNYIFFIFSGTFMKEYQFDNKIFYMYNTTVMMDYCLDVDIKMDYLPIRKNLISLCNEYNLTLDRQDEVIFLKTEERGDIEIYHLKNK